MTKPIFIIRIPLEAVKDDRPHFDRIHESIQKSLHDYHVLSLVENHIDKVEFECYNTPHTEIEFEKLKKLVLKKLNKKLNPKTKES